MSAYLLNASLSGRPTVPVHCGLAMTWYRQEFTSFGDWTAPGTGGTVVFFQGSRISLAGVLSSYVVADATGGVWHQDIVSWRTSTNTLQFMRDGALLTPSLEAWLSTNGVDYTVNAEWALNIGQFGGSGQPMQSDFFFWCPATTPDDDLLFDLSDSGNVALLRNLDGTPKDLGNGSGICFGGRQALVAFHGDSTDYGTNHGLGGDFVVTGDALEVTELSPWP